MQRWQCRVAPSLGSGFAGTPNQVWGTDDHTDTERPTVFFGMYGLPDLYTLWRHRGTKAVLWAGSDIQHFTNGYWLDQEGKIRLNPHAIARWLKENTESYVENTVEQAKLAQLGVHAKIVPSFLGNVLDYNQCYEYNGKTQLYTSVSGDDFELYGWHEIESLAWEHPDVEFHLYGNSKEWTTTAPNVYVHGRIGQEEMNNQIRGMTGALRLTKFDGFSEILAKSILWGQHPVSPYIPYSYMYQDIAKVKGKEEPNTEGRAYYLEHLNQYPWNENN